MSYFKKILMPIFVITTFSLTANSMESVFEDSSDSEEKIFSQDTNEGFFNKSTPIAFMHRLYQDKDSYGCNYSKMSSGGGFPPPLNQDLFDIRVKVKIPKLNRPLA